MSLSYRDQCPFHFSLSRFANQLTDFYMRGTLVIKGFAIFPKKTLLILQFYEFLAPAQVFSCKFCEIFQNNYSPVYLWTVAFVDACYYKKQKHSLSLLMEVLQSRNATVTLYKRIKIEK